MANERGLLFYVSKNLKDILTTRLANSPADGKLC